jgi:enoyl-CoA hydratase/carnithine racemase
MPASSPDQDLVLSERRGNVLLLTLNRPDRLNAWTDPLERRYFDLLAEAEADPEIGAVVLTGAGRGFCAGVDFETLESAVEDLESVAAVERARRSIPLESRLPLIAAVNGHAVGLGLVEAVYCDVRFATPTAKFITAFAQRGLIAEYGLSWLLPRLVGHSNAVDLLLSSRPVSGEEALAMGLVNRLVEPENLVEEAVAYAQHLASNSSPAAMATIKEQIRRDLGSDFEQALSTSEALIMESFEWPDVQEGVASYLEKRPPRFAPLPPRKAEARA